jgi:hypothetical protein
MPTLGRAKISARRGCRYSLRYAAPDLSRSVVAASVIVSNLPLVFSQVVGKPIPPRGSNPARFAKSG